MSRRKNSALRVIASVLGSVICIALAISAVRIGIESKPEPQITPQSVSLPRVEVKSISAADYAPVVRTQGTVTARYSGTLVAQVEGQVTGVSDQLLTGSLFHKGDVLVHVDATKYLSNKAGAESDLAARERELAEEESRARQAQRDWERSGLTDRKPSQLTLREPQLKSARAQVAAAKAALTLATHDLERTEVRAPYAGAVISRQVSPGDYVQTGQALAEIYAHHAIEIALPLSQSQIALLGNRNAIDPVNITVSSMDDEQRHWRVRSWRLGRTIDPTNRWQPLIVELETDEKDTPLPGEFLQAIIEGPTRSGLFALSESAIASDGGIWYVDDQEELAVYAPPILFRSEGVVYVEPPLDVTELNIVRFPQSEFLPGTRVESVFHVDHSFDNKTAASGAL